MQPLEQRKRGPIRVETPPTHPDPVEQAIEETFQEAMGKKPKVHWTQTPEGKAKLSKQMKKLHAQGVKFRHGKSKSTKRGGKMEANPERHKTVAKAIKLMVTYGGQSRKFSASSISDRLALPKTGSGNHSSTQRSAISQLLIRLERARIIKCINPEFRKYREYVVIKQNAIERVAAQNGGRFDFIAASKARSYNRRAKPVNGEAELHDEPVHPKPGPGGVLFDKLQKLQDAQDNMQKTLAHILDVADKLGTVWGV